MKKLDEPSVSKVGRLSDLGIDVQLTPGVPDQGWAPALLSRGGVQQEYSLFVKPRASLPVLTQLPTGQAPTLLLTDFVSPRTADALRRVDVQYADSAGNAWIQFGDVLIDVRGRPRPHGITSAPATGSLFSTARSKVIFALLAWPELWHATQRDLARAADVSVGQAHNTRLLLAEAGYETNSRPAGKPDLLDLWAAAFPTGLARKLARATYSGRVGPLEPASAHDVLYLSGESAMPDHLRPATLTLYAENLDPRLPLVNRWRSDGPVTIEVRHAFWRSPDGTPPGVHVAPWPLVYVDLASSDDPRAREAARLWREAHAEPGPGA